MRTYLLTIITILSFFVGNPQQTPREIGNQSIYPRTFLVYEIDEEYDIMYMVDGAGLDWSWKGTEDYNVGDYVCAIMGDNETPNYIYDDIMLELRYAGFYEEEVNGN